MWQTQYLLVHYYHHLHLCSCFHIYYWFLYLSLYGVCMFSMWCGVCVRARVCMCMQVHSLMHMCAEVREDAECSRLLLLALLPWDWKLFISARLAGQWDLGIHLSVLGYRHEQSCLTFLHDVGILSHVFMHTKCFCSPKQLRRLMLPYSLIHIYLL